MRTTEKINVRGQCLYLSYTKICNLQSLVICYQQVARFNVLVDYAMAVQVLQAVHQLTEIPESVRKISVRKCQAAIHNLLFKNYKTYQEPLQDQLTLIKNVFFRLVQRWLDLQLKCSMGLDSQSHINPFSHLL